MGSYFLNTQYDVDKDHTKCRLHTRFFFIHNDNQPKFNFIEFGYVLEFDQLYIISKFHYISSGKSIFNVFKSGVNIKSAFFLFIFLEL